MTHPAIRDAYQKGFQDGVLTTLEELEKTGHLPADIEKWAETVREKIKADRG